MKKEIIVVNNNEFDFFFDERLNMWRIIEDKNIISGYTLDIEVDMKNQSEEFEISQISSFLQYVNLNNEAIYINVNNSKTVLLSLFQTLYKNAFDKDVLENIGFNFVGIDYKGYSKTYQDKFQYDFQFFPFYKKDLHQDIGSFLWKAFFRDRLLLGVYADTQ